MNTTMLKRSSIKLGFIGTIIFVCLGLLGVSPASADDNTYEVESISYSSDVATATAKAAVRLTFEGRDQVTWEEEDHNSRISGAAVRNAPQVKVNPSMDSADLAAKSDHAKFVIVFGQWKNHGMLGKLKVPFITTARYPGMVMMWNKKLDIYEHAFTLKIPNRVTAEDEVLFTTTVKIKGKKVKVAVVKSCKNDFGGKGKPREVVIVRYKADIEMETEVNAYAAVSSKVTVTRQCPGGPVTAEASASASASSSAIVRAKARFLIADVELKKEELKNMLSGKVKGEARAKAETQAKVSITCGDAPPPPPVVEKPLFAQFG